MSSTTSDPVAAQNSQRVYIANGTKPRGTQRLIIFLHSFAFVIGFGVVFTLLGSAAGLLGSSLFQYQITIQKMGAVLLIIFGLTMMGVIGKLSALLNQQFDLTNNRFVAMLDKGLTFLQTLLYTERRVMDMHEVNQGWGYASSFAIGVSFSAGWVPCIGPILASILFLASDSATVGQGAALLAVYSLGLGIPFLLTGLAFSTMTGFLRKLNRYLSIVSMISGLFMIVIGYYLWTNQLIMLVGQFAFLNEWVFLMEEWVTRSVGFTGIDTTSVNALSAAPIALLAGVISFISPCVLPLVPAYVGYLSGTSLTNA